MRRARADEQAEREPADERLEQLLAVEQRLEDLVRAAAEEAARRVEAARAAGERQLAVARADAQRADDARSREERNALADSLAAIDLSHRRALDAIAGVTDERVDALARWALDQVIGGRGGAT
jgi:hypothetical protein